MNKSRAFLKGLVVLSTLCCLSLLFAPPQQSLAQSINPQSPVEPIKLIFIHHSCGENWLTDGNGNLGHALGNNNYFVSDTNYGWGPDSIGDATDYYNWYDWFNGPESSRYLQALYNENGQNSSYTRPISDPGGENRIIMFKSCFPNSDLSGNPGDAAADGEWMTVGHAKYVYNQLLAYFATRPDKLFIAITPPPLINRANAENAREFSRWMVEDWLRENNYDLPNVAVWDFHNVLTHPDNHHRIQGGSVEYIINNGNGSLHYDSAGDDHPNNAGNQKSTQEFVPMLNAFYNNWISGSDMLPVTLAEEHEPNKAEPDQPPAEPLPQELPGGPIADEMIDDFEGDTPVGTNGWEYYVGNPTASSLTCEIDSDTALSGSSSLRIDVNLGANDWGTCSLFYDVPPDFRTYGAIAFDYHAAAQGFLFNVDVTGGTPDARQMYAYTVETVPESVSSWVHVEIVWNHIVGVDWEANAGKPINPAEINGFTFGFNTFPDAPNEGTLWIDNLHLIETGPPPPPVTEGDDEPAPPSVEDDQAGEEPVAEEDQAVVEPEPEAEDQAESDEDEGGRRGLCPGSTAMIALVLFMGIFAQVRMSRNDNKS